ncbi:MAG: HD domain-containing protein, partial [Burkholderiales bacterium]|nr:HD domain-containing protein [Burkholderiales bacterium]
VHERAICLGINELAHPAANACGLLCSDTVDFAAAIDYHGQALLITEADGDLVASSRLWNNIGGALSIVGQYDNAMKCFQRSLEKVESLPSPLFSRFSAFTNLAQCEFYLRDTPSGLYFSELALNELRAATGGEKYDAYAQILLRRNTVRLLIDADRVADAELHAQQAVALAKQDGGLRASIAAATTLAVLEIAKGDSDVALTRLERSLADSRSVWPAFRDTLTCAIRAEEAIGSPEKALIRLRELSELLHDRGRRSAIGHLAIANWRLEGNAQNLVAFKAAESRLQTRLQQPSVPRTWQTFSRIAVGNAMQVDASSEHGLRVGALTQLLAQAHGFSPIDALEIGLAAQLHDIGLAAGHENLFKPHAASLSGTSHVDAAHCEAGWQILCEDSHARLLLARDIAKYHHAWWNGRGYPNGVAGLAIPIHARMCAVADAYDSLVENTPDDGPRSMNDAFIQLEQAAGSQLDPQLVRCFINAVRNEADNEGVSFVADDGLTCFHQLIAALSSGRNFL